MMPDLGKDAPVCVNESGGKQSVLDVSLVRVPPHALIAIGKVLASGAKKYPDHADGTPNWHRIDVRDHLNHMLTHAMAYLAGDTQDDHLEHMACRALMALERKYLDEKKEKDDKFWEEEGRKFAREMIERRKSECGPEPSILGGLVVAIPTEESDWWLKGFNEWLLLNPAAIDEESDIKYLQKYFRSGLSGQADHYWTPPLTGYRLKCMHAGREYGIKQKLIDQSA